MQAQQILRNEGFGAAEGFSVNMTFLMQEGDRMFHNAEVGPCEINGTQSQLSILTVSPGENTVHCNKYIFSIFLTMTFLLLSGVSNLSSSLSFFRYLRLKIPEVDGLIVDSSIKRMAAICNHPPAKCRQDVINILSDQTDDDYRVYQEKDKDDPVKTIATGRFSN